MKEFANWIYFLLIVYLSQTDGLPLDSETLVAKPSVVKQKVIITGVVPPKKSPKQDPDDTLVGSVIDFLAEAADIINPVGDSYDQVTTFLTNATSQIGTVYKYQQEFQQFLASKSTTVAPAAADSNLTNNGPQVQVVNYQTPNGETNSLQIIRIPEGGIVSPNNNNLQQGFNNVNNIPNPQAVSGTPAVSIVHKGSSTNEYQSPPNTINNNEPIRANFQSPVNPNSQISSNNNNNFNGNNYVANSNNNNNINGNNYVAGTTGIINTNTNNIPIVSFPGSNNNNIGVPPAPAVAGETAPIVTKKVVTPNRYIVPDNQPIDSFFKNPVLKDYDDEYENTIGVFNKISSTTKKPFELIETTTVNNVESNSEDDDEEEDNNPSVSAKKSPSSASSSSSLLSNKPAVYNNKNSISTLFGELPLLKKGAVEKYVEYKEDDENDNHFDKKEFSKTHQLYVETTQSPPGPTTFASKLVQFKGPSKNSVPDFDVQIADLLRGKVSTLGASQTKIAPLPVVEIKKPLQARPSPINIVDLRQKPVIPKVVPVNAETTPAADDEEEEEDEDENRREK